MATYSWYAQGEKAPPVDATLELVGNDGVLPSAFSGAIQTIVRPKVWRYSLSWRNITGSERAAILGFFLRLNGTEHRCRLPLFGHVQRGTLNGTPVVDGGGQTGHSINIRGATSSQTGWIKAGDIFRWGNTLHMCTLDADSDISGDVTVEFVPEIRNSPSDGDSVVVTATMTGIFMLESNVQANSSAMRRLASGDAVGDLDLTFIDDIRAD